MRGRSNTDDALLTLLGVQGGAWTTADAAIATGLPLNIVEPRLLALAVASGAQLRVSKDGNVTYVFRSQLRRFLLARSWRLRLHACLRRVWSLLFWIIRCSFGVVLVVMVVLISLLVLLLGLALLKAEDDAANALMSFVGGGLELILRIVVAVLTDQFWIGSPGRFPSGKDQSPPNRVAFLESVYSILFGDGDPNQDLDQKRWQRIGSFLRHRGGVVIAEDLAPLLDLGSPPSRSQRTELNPSELKLSELQPHESLVAAERADQGMLPVLLHFDGQPQVTDQGDLLYCFPSLYGGAAEGLSSADSSSEERSKAKGVSLPLRERRIPFTHANQWQRRAYGVLVVILLGMSLLLLNWSLPVSASLVGIATFGIIYSLLLIVLPLVRWLVWRRSNTVIQERNLMRQQWANWIHLHNDDLTSKRQKATDFIRTMEHEKSSLIYTTEKDWISQPIIEEENLGF